MIRVMVVDDHVVLRDGISHVIRLQEGMEVVSEASSGEEFRRKIKNCAPNVIILDIHLQDVSGIELTQLVKEDYPECKVLILTFSDNDYYLQASMDAGADGYLLKEMSSEELVYGIKSVYKGNCVIPPSMTKALLHNQNKKENVQSKTLTQREFEVLRELSKGLSNKEIAHILFISDKTVKIHISNIYKKLKVKSRSQALLYAVKQQWFNPSDVHSFAE
ncbi:response regulator [Halobacillus faecis]